MIALISVIITGKPPSTCLIEQMADHSFELHRHCISWSGCCAAELCQHSCSAGQECWSSLGWIPCGYCRMEMVSRVSHGPYRTCHVFVQTTIAYLPCHTDIISRLQQKQLTISRSFGGQAPLALVCLIAVTLKLTPESPVNKTQGSGRFKALLRNMDWLGAILSAIGITTGLGAISLGGRKLPWSHPLIILALTGCLISAAFFMLTERYHARFPLLPPKLIKHNGIGLICVIQVLLCAARFGVGGMSTLLMKVC